MLDPLGLKKNALAAIHHELSRMASPQRGNWINHVRRRSSFLSSRIEEVEELSREEAAYVTQGESALQEAISILGEQDGWTTETLAVSSQNQVPPK